MARLLINAFAALLLILGTALSANAQGASSIAEAVSNTPNLSTLLAAAEAAGLVEALSDGSAAYTVFAPTDEAFASALEQFGLTAEQLLASGPLLEELLRYHVVPAAALQASQVPTTPTTLDTLAGGAPFKDLEVVAVDGGVTVTATGSEARVVTADVTAGNSVVHIVDTVLLPFYTSVAQAAVRNDLTILLAAVEAAGLTGTLSDPAFQATVFAPTNEAFLALVNSLCLTPEVVLADTELLQSVLNLHVVPGVVAFSSELTDGQELDTLSNKDLEVSLDGEGVKIIAPKSTATVVVPDVPIAAGSAVVHVVDTVLLPKKVKSMCNRKGKGPCVVYRG